MKHQQFYLFKFVMIRIKKLKALNKYKWESISREKRRKLGSNENWLSKGVASYKTIVELFNCCYLFNFLCLLAINRATFWCITFHKRASNALRKVNNLGAIIHIKKIEFWEVKDLVFMTHQRLYICFIRESPNLAQR